MLVACARGAGNGAANVSWQIDSRTGRVTQLSLRLGRGSALEGRREAFVSTGLGGSYWRADARTSDDGAVTLEPESRYFPVYANDGAWVYVDGADGRRTLIGSATIESNSVPNADFAFWPRNNPAPFGWTASGTGNIVPAVENRVPGVLLSLTPNEQGDQRVALSAYLVPNPIAITYREYPLANCDLSSAPAYLVGVQIVDSAWNRVTLCIDSHASSVRVVGEANGNVIFAIPGRLRTWNTVHTGALDISSLMHFTPDRLGMVQVGPTVMTSRGKGPVIGAAFSGFTDR